MAGVVQSGYSIYPKQTPPRQVVVTVNLPPDTSAEVAENMRLALQACAQAWISDKPEFPLESIDAKIR